MSLEPGPFLRVVREQSHRADPEVVEDLRADAVVALVGGESELEVRLDRVATTLLELVRAELVGDADGATLVPADVEDHASPFTSDQLHRPIQLLAAVASERAEHIAGQALGMHAGEEVGGVTRLARYTRDVGQPVHDGC